MCVRGVYFTPWPPGFSLIHHLVVGHSLGADVSLEAVSQASRQSQTCFILINEAADQNTRARACEGAVLIFGGQAAKICSMVLVCSVETTAVSGVFLI